MWGLLQKETSLDYSRIVYMTGLGQTFTYEQMLHITGNFSEENLSNMATLETFSQGFWKVGFS